MDRKILFCELSEIWLKKAKTGVCYIYQRNLESYVSHLNRYIGEKKVADIKPYDIDIIIEELAACNPNTKKPASKKFLKSVVSTAQRIFDFANENELIYKNPAKNKKKSVPKNAPQKTVYEITPEQQQLVIDVEHRAKIAAVIMMFMGLRTGELLALEWNDVDLLNLKLTVNKRAQRTDTNEYTVVPGTKNGKTRYVAIPENLGKWLGKKKAIATSHLVCPGLHNDLQTPTQWKRLWNSYQNEINYYCYTKNCKEVGIAPNNRHTPKGIPKVATRFNPHQLRHTYATLLYISGVDVMTASALLGHSNIEITLKVYTHLNQKFKAQNISKFNNYIKADLDIDNI